METFPLFQAAGGCRRGQMGIKMRILAYEGRAASDQRFSSKTTSLFTAQACRRGNRLLFAPAENDDGSGSAQTEGRMRHRYGAEYH